MCVCFVRHPGWACLPLCSISGQVIGEAELHFVCRPKKTIRVRILVFCEDFLPRTEKSGHSFTVAICELCASNASPKNLSWTVVGLIIVWQYAIKYLPWGKIIVQMGTKTNARERLWTNQNRTVRTEMDEKRNKSHEPHTTHTNTHTQTNMTIFVSSWMRAGYFWKYFIGYGISPRCAKA